MSDVSDVIKLEEHMLANTDGDAERCDELRGYFRRYPFSVVDNIVNGGVAYDGYAWFSSGAIELSRSLLAAPPARALHVYLHELAHIVANDGHSLDFALLAARLQQRFRCRDTSRQSLRYDLHEATVDEWRTSEYAHLRAGGSVQALADPEVWIEHRRASREAREAELDRQRFLWPSLAALVVAGVVIGGCVFWPSISALFSSDQGKIATFVAGLLLVGWAVGAAVKC